MRILSTTLLVAFFGCGDLTAGAQEPAGGALADNASVPPRVIVSSDIGGSDPDDFQSMIHLLLYANVLDIEGLISSPPQAGRARHIHEVLDAYARDFPNLQGHSGRTGRRKEDKEFPHPETLRAVVKQGAVRAAPATGWSSPTPGSRWIVARAKAEEQRPLWVLVWGGITDVAQAVHDEPTIKSRIRIYSIGSWNTRQDRAARDSLFQHHRDLWWIECDTTFRGMYMGGEQRGEWNNLQFVEQHVRGHGALGDLFWAKKKDIKMGDTPSLLYLLRGAPDRPDSPHWGGAFRKTDHGPHYWTDDPKPEHSENQRAGAKTVNRWRKDYLRDWRMRMDWLQR